MKRHLLTGFVAAVVLIILPTLASADGEPGAQCPGCEDAQCQYVAPPYTGTIIAKWELCNLGGPSSYCIFIKGSVTQVGKSECSGNFDWTFLGGADLYTQSWFQNINPSDLRGSCLIHLMEGTPPPFNCIQVGFPELLAVGNMKYGTQPCRDEGLNETNCLTANAVVMQVYVP